MDIVLQMAMLRSEINQLRVDLEAVELSRGFPPNVEPAVPPGVFPAQGGGGGDWDDTSMWAFGYAAPTSDDVTVTAGRLNVGIPYWDYAGGTVTVVGEGYGYIGWQWEGSGLTVKYSTHIGEFVHTTERLAGWFHKWHLVDGVAVPVAIGHLGNLDFAGEFAVPANV